jgi:hypothetical protein
MRHYIRNKYFLPPSATTVVCIFSGREEDDEQRMRGDKRML